MAYTAGGLSPWFTGSQAAFDAFASQGKPESKLDRRCRAAIASHSSAAISPFFEAQLNYYRVIFSDRLARRFEQPGRHRRRRDRRWHHGAHQRWCGAHDGVDAAFTLRFGRALSVYNATSYNSSTYQSDYTSTASGIGAATGTCIGGLVVTNGIVPTCGKQIPASPKWMNKTVATLALEPFELQLIGDYVGERFSTFVNDTSVGASFPASARAGASATKHAADQKSGDQSQTSPTSPIRPAGRRSPSAVGDQFVFRV
jgi:hypothetical protein